MDLNVSGIMASCLVFVFIEMFFYRMFVNSLLFPFVLTVDYINFP